MTDLAIALSDQLTDIRSNLSVDSLGTPRGANTTTAQNALNDIISKTGVSYTFSNVSLLNVSYYRKFMFFLTTAAKLLF